MTRVLFIVLMLFSTASLSASFDCKKAASLPEMLICNDPELSKLDDELSVIYKEAKSSAADPLTFKEQTRAAWKWREANCHTKECLLSWYVNRKKLLLNNSESTRVCLKDGESVTLTGGLSRETFPGPPNYESIDNGDAPETVWVLTVERPQCVTAEEMESGAQYEVAKSTTRFQLGLNNPSLYETHRHLLDHPVVVTGQVFVGITGHYHTAASISTGKIERAGKR